MYYGSLQRTVCDTIAKLWDTYICEHLVELSACCSQTFDSIIFQHFNPAKAVVLTIIPATRLWRLTHKMFR